MVGRVGLVGVLLLAATACGAVVPSVPGVAASAASAGTPASATAAGSSAPTVSAAALAATAAAGPAPRPVCQFVRGFAELQAVLGEIVGDCVEDERPEAVGGGSQQRTTRGLMVWRRADGLVAFTDGGRTWVRAPDGAVYQRANDQRFGWEAAPPAGSAAPPVVTPGAAFKAGPAAAVPVSTRATAASATGQAAPKASTGMLGSFRGPQELGVHLERGVVVMRGSLKGSRPGRHLEEFCRGIKTIGPNRKSLNYTCTGSGDEYTIVATVEQAGIQAVTVTAPVDWTLAIEQPVPSNPLPLPRTFQASRPGVTPFFRLDGRPATVRITVKDLMSFVHLLDANGEKVQDLVPEKRALDWTARVAGRQGPHLISVITSGEWSVRVEDTDPRSATTVTPTGVRPTGAQPGRQTPSDDRSGQSLGEFAVVVRGVQVATDMPHVAKLDDPINRQVVQMGLQSLRTLGPKAQQEAQQERLPVGLQEFGPDIRAAVKEASAAAEDIAVALDTRETPRIVAASQRLRAASEKLDGVSERIKVKLAKPGG